MKQLITSLLLLLSIAVFAQNFEGTISWSMKMEITDPAAKAKMDAAQKKMSDPATQAQIQEQIKQHQDKMVNDPQYKAMMESNPQIKAQMEMMMSQVQSGNVNSLIPSGFIIKMKNQNTLTKIEGGMMAGEFLYLSEGNKSYHINHDSKTYSVMNNVSNQNEVQKPDVKVTKTGETAKILNYTCTKYTVALKQGDKTLNHVIWATTEIKDIDMKAIAKNGMAGRSSFFYEGVEGVPLKMEMNMPEGKMLIEAKEIKRESLAATLFSLPAGYKEVTSMMGMPGRTH